MEGAESLPLGGTSELEPEGQKESAVCGGGRTFQAEARGSAKALRL